MSTNASKMEKISKRGQLLEDVVSRVVIASLNSVHSHQAWKHLYQQQAKTISDEQIADNLTTLTELVVTSSIDSLREWIQHRKLQQIFQVVEEHTLVQYAEASICNSHSDSQLTTPKSSFPHLTKTHVRNAAKKTHLEKLQAELAQKEAALEEKRARLAKQLEETQQLCHNVANSSLATISLHNAFETVSTETS